MVRNSRNYKDCKFLYIVIFRFVLVYIFNIFCRTFFFGVEFLLVDKRRGGNYSGLGLIEKVG